MKILAVDLGIKRIGLAVATSEGRLPQALPILDAIGTLKKDALNVRTQARQVQADLILMGIPYNDQYKDDRMEKICRRFGAELELLGEKVDYYDEAFTSWEAERSLEHLKASQRKAVLDSQSACILLARYLDAKVD